MAAPDLEVMMLDAYTCATIVKLLRRCTIDCDSQLCSPTADYDTVYWTPKHPVHV